MPCSPQIKGEMLPEIYTVSHTYNSFSNNFFIKVKLFNDPSVTQTCYIVPQQDVSNNFFVSVRSQLKLVKVAMTYLCKEQIANLRNIERRLLNSKFGHNLSNQS